MFLKTCYNLFKEANGRLRSCEISRKDKWLANLISNIVPGIIALSLILALANAMIFYEYIEVLAFGIVFAIIAFFAMHMFMYNTYIAAVCPAYRKKDYQYVTHCILLIIFLVLLVLYTVFIIIFKEMKL